jgi:membrane-associated phospholipid phosphatase
MTTIQAFTDFADSAVLLPVSILLFVWLWSRQSKVAALWWIAAIGLCVGTTIIFKIYFSVCPLGADLHSPSGHTGFGTLVYGGLATIVAAESQARQRLLVLAAGAALILAIGLSRIALNAHSVAEVAFGFVVGSAALALFAVSYLRHRSAPVTLSWLIVVALVLVSLFHGQQLNAEEFLHTLGVHLHHDGMACIV